MEVEEDNYQKSKDFKREIAVMLNRCEPWVYSIGGELSAETLKWHFLLLHLKA